MTCLGMGKPLVSIIMPFRNAAVFLEACVQSVVDQSLTSWELLAVNDRSDDDGPAIIKGFQGTYSNIQLIESEGTGIIDALKTGYAHSSGRLITRMDADDLMAPNKLEVMSEQLLDAGKGHLATGLVKYFAADGVKDGYRRYEQWLNRLANKGANFSELYKECVIPSPCFMLYREDLNRCGAFNENRYPEDYDLAFRFYENGLQCLPATKVLHHWRDYSSRTSRTDEHYADNRFLNLKLHYFLKLHRDATRPLVVWGAGTKGKSTIKQLQAKDQSVHWVCDNDKKIGKDIYGIRMESYETLKAIPHPQIIVTVANEADQLQVQEFLDNLNSKPMEDHFFFC